MYVFLLLIIGIIFPFLILDWHARGVFVYTVYPRRYGHGKSGNRAFKHYKANWSIIQRLLWIPLFNEWYETKYRIIAYFSYTHAFITLLTIVCFLLEEFVISSSGFWVKIYVLFAVLSIIRFIYDNDLGRGKI